MLRRRLHFTARAAARGAVLARAGWDVEENGVFAAPPITVIMGHEAHPSLMTSLSMLGLGRSRIVRVPSDEQGRMRPSGIPLISGPTTFGLWAKASPLLRPLARGLQQADSWATDAREWLDVPYDSGLVFVCDPNTLPTATAIAAEIPSSDRPVRGVEVWAALRSLGAAGLAELFERNCRQARRFARDLRSAGYEILNEVVLNRVVVAFGDVTRARRLAAALLKEGVDCCELTEWRGRIALRSTIRSWAMADEDVERSVQTVIRIAAAT